MNARDGLLEDVVRAIDALRVDHPVRIAVDGRSAAGKTTFADALARVVQARGREALRVALDDFHRPGHKRRSIERAWTPELYYAEGYDYDAFARVALEPLGPRGSRRVRPRSFDSFRDQPFPEAWVQVADDAAAVVDGAFLLRPELAPHWDLVVWLDIDFETMVRRAKQRDVAWVGDAEEVERRYRELWVPLHSLYERQERPAERAAIVIDNRDWTAPRLVRSARARS